LANKSERRKHPRIETRWPITVLVGDKPLEGETINITVDGIYISCEEPLRLNKIYRLLIRPPNSKNIELAGKVMWSDMYGIDGEKNAFGMGFCFVQVSDEGHDFLIDMISVHHKK